MYFAPVTSLHFWTLFLYNHVIDHIESPLVSQTPETFDISPRECPLLAQSV